MREQLERLIDEMVTKGIRYPDALREFERRYISRVLAGTGSNMCRAAQALGIHRNTRSRKLAGHRLKRTAG